jgi:putative membrane protein
MKTFLRNIVVNFLALFLAARITGGVVYNDNYLVLIWAAIFLTLLNLLIKPILNMLLMPINMVTLGAFRWVVNVVVLFLVMVIVSDFKIIGFVFPGLTFAGFVVPKIAFTFFWALILISLAIELLTGLINWVFN